ncbi:MAG TPA: Flp family type IVb pilin [Pseudolabrys sp.]|jgi:pilus assembly protein Flp/PilA
MSEFRNGAAAHLRRLLKDYRGATAIEYAIVASGVSLAIMSTIWTLGSSVKTNLYDKLSAMF